MTGHKDMRLLDKTYIPRTKTKIKDASNKMKNKIAQK